MQTIFITIAESAVIRNLLRTEFWSTVRADPKCRIVLLAPPEFKEALHEFSGEYVIVEPVGRSVVSRKESVLAFIARNGFVSGTNAIMQHRVYAQHETRIPPWIKSLIAFVVGALPFIRSVARAQELQISPSPDVAAVYKKYLPALVFSTVLMDTSLDVPILREARRRSIKTVGMVRGWDNLTTYGFLRVLPDVFLAQNDFLAEAAYRYHDVQKDCVEIVGTPYFDVYGRRDLLVSREEYFRHMQIDPAQRLVLYGAIGDYLFPKEGELADIFDSMISDGSLPANTTVIFRAHPAFTSPLERMKSLKHVIPNRSANYTGSNLQHWDMNTAQTVHLLNSIYHADAVVTAGSTLMIEAALLDRPVVTVAFDGNSIEPYWFSIARFHDKAVHILDLLRTGGVRVAHNKGELAAHITAYMQDASLDRAERRTLVERFAGPHRGKSGTYLGEQLLALLSDDKRNASR